jgi:hypothetical protein
MQSKPSLNPVVDYGVKSKICIRSIRFVGQNAVATPARPVAHVTLDWKAGEARTTPRAVARGAMSASTCDGARAILVSDVASVLRGRSPFQGP